MKCDFGPLGRSDKGVMLDGNGSDDNEDDHNSKYKNGEDSVSDNGRDDDIFVAVADRIGDKTPLSGTIARH